MFFQHKLKIITYKRLANDKIKIKIFDLNFRLNLTFLYFLSKFWL